MFARPTPHLSAIVRSDAGIAVLLALAAFALYLTTLGRSIGYTDAGELAAVAHGFGIAHPTGYPLFTLLAGLFAKLPLGGTVIWKLNLLAAIWTAGAVALFFLFFRTLLRSALPALQDGHTRAGAVIGALTLAVSRTFRAQSAGIEVYSLHLLLIALTLWLFAVALQGSRRAWLLCAFCLGLSFSNHLTTVLLLPGLAVAFFAVHGFGGSAWKAIAQAGAVFVAGLTPYLYLPLRAAAAPVLNWGDPVTWEAFWRHVTGRQYRVWMFSSPDAALAQLGVFLREFPAVFGFAALAPMAFGLVVLARGGTPGRRALLWTALLFVACVVYAINYDIHDISNYFLLAYVAAAVWIAAGAAVVLDWSAARWPSSRAGTARLLPAAALLAVCTLPPLALHHRAVDERDNFAVEDYARNLLDALDPGAVLLTYQWDHFVAGAWYLQQVEGHRADVTILERELLRRTWYIAQLRRNHPEVMEPARAETDAFLDAVRPFERGLPYDGAAIQTAFEAMIRALMHAAAARGPAYVTPEVEREYLRGLGGVPEGLTFRLFTDSLPPEVPPPSFRFRPVPPRGHLSDGLLRAYAAGYVNGAIAQASMGRYALANSLLDEALAVRPGYSPALELRRRMEGVRKEE